MSTEVRSFEFDDGKYGITLTDGRMKFFRHGEPWPAGQRAFQFVGMVLAMVYRVQELEDRVSQLEADLRGHEGDPD